MGMLFSLSPGSNGAGEERYVAYIPFSVAQGFTISSAESVVSSQHGRYMITLKRHHNFYSLSSGPHSSEADAEAHLEILRASLLWYSLTHGVGISYPNTSDKPTLYDTPVIGNDSNIFTQIFRDRGWDALDGDYDAGKAYVLPDHKRLSCWENGVVTVTVGTPGDLFVDSLKERLSVQTIGAVSRNDKLRLAIELYATYRFEVSDNARLLTLISALEAVYPRRDIPSVAQEALTEAKKLLANIRDTHAQGTDAYDALNRLVSRVGGLSAEAIGQSMRSHVSSVMERHPVLGEIDAVTKQIIKAYDTRSTLLHYGQADNAEISNSLSFLQDFVKRFLMVLFLEETGEHDEGIGLRH